MQLESHFKRICCLERFHFWLGRLKCAAAARFAEGEFGLNVEGKWCCRNLYEPLFGVTWSETSWTAVMACSKYQLILVNVECCHAGNHSQGWFMGTEDYTCKIRKKRGCLFNSLPFRGVASLEDFWNHPSDLSLLEFGTKNVRICLLSLPLSPLLQQRRDVSLFSKQCSKAGSVTADLFLYSASAVCRRLIMFGIFSALQLKNICMKFVMAPKSKAKPKRWDFYWRQADLNVWMTRGTRFSSSSRLCQLVIQSCTTQTSGLIIQGRAAGSLDSEWLLKVERHTARWISEAELMAVGEILLIVC